MVELNRLFQIDQGKTASEARILSLKQTRWPLPCLLSQSFFYMTSILERSPFPNFYRWLMLLNHVAQKPDISLHSLQPWRARILQVLQLHRFCFGTVYMVYLFTTVCAEQPCSIIKKRLNSSWLPCLLILSFFYASPIPCWSINVRIWPGLKSGKYFAYV